MKKSIVKNKDIENAFNVFVPSIYKIDIITNNRGYAK